MIPTLLSHFPWRRARSMIFGGKLEQTLTLPNRFSLAGLDVEKKDGEGNTPHSGRFSFLEYGMKTFFDCVFLTGNHFCMLVSPCFNLVCAFAPVLSEKSAFLCAKVAKTSFLAFLKFFLGTSSSALCIIHSTCKKR